jgi:hypothetical protein
MALPTSAAASLRARFHEIAAKQSRGRPQGLADWHSRNHEPFCDLTGPTGHPKTRPRRWSNCRCFGDPICQPHPSQGLSTKTALEAPQKYASYSWPTSGALLDNELVPRYEQNRTERYTLHSIIYRRSNSHCCSGDWPCLPERNPA